MRRLFLANFICICLFTHFFASGAEIKMAYSDLVPSALQKFLYNDSVLSDDGLDSGIINLSAYQSGSLPMIEDFLSERLDICILALPEGGEFPVLDNDNITKIPFGYKSSVVVVNAENPISEITIGQLSSMFGDTSTVGNLMSWRDFGMSSFSSSFIKSYSVKEDFGISSDLFRYTVLNEKPFSPSVTLESYDNVQRLILQDKAAIGVFPNKPENPNLKVLFVAQDNESIAYGPSIDNVYYADYPIRLPFYIVYNSTDNKQLFPLINSLLSENVADIISESDFFPVPKVIREKLIIDLQLYLQENGN